jgi:hypothetical protein
LSAVRAESQADNANDDEEDPGQTPWRSRFAKDIDSDDRHGGNTSPRPYSVGGSRRDGFQKVIAAWGCERGKFERESEGSGILEAEDVICRGGQYDFRLDKIFLRSCDYQGLTLPIA